MLLVPTQQQRDRTLDLPNMHRPEDQLWCLQQGGRPLERYVEEFLKLSYCGSWHDAALCETHLASPAHPTLGPPTFPANDFNCPLPPIYPQAHGWTLDGADLGAKMTNPTCQSVRSALQSTSLFLSSVLSSVSVISKEKAATPQSSLPAVPPVETASRSTVQITAHSPVWPAGYSTIMPAGHSAVTPTDRFTTKP